MSWLTFLETAVYQEIIPTGFREVLLLSKLMQKIIASTLLLYTMVHAVTHLLCDWSTSFWILHFLEKHRISNPALKIGSDATPERMTMGFCWFSVLIPYKLMLQYRGAEEISPTPLLFRPRMRNLWPPEMAGTTKPISSHSHTEWEDGLCSRTTCGQTLVPKFSKLDF